MSEHTVPRGASGNDGASAVLFGVGAVAVAAGLWLAARWSAQLVLVALNRASFSARPEIENWADPVAGTHSPAVIIACAVVLLAAATAAIALWRSRRARS